MKSCHRSNFTTSGYHPHAELRGQSIAPYSDFLLHDMGDGLADTLGEGVASGHEWRTAPLWGVGAGPSSLEASRVPTKTRPVSKTRACDGRARTLDGSHPVARRRRAASRQAYGEAIRGRTRGPNRILKLPITPRDRTPESLGRHHRRN